MATWIVGDIHGCAEELERLVERLKLAPTDRLVSVGDLFHRGPDPVGVARALDRIGASFVLGNHELAVLRRAGLAPASIDPADRPPTRDAFPTLTDDDLAGDGATPCRVEPDQRVELLRFLQKHAGFTLASSDVASSTRDGRPWSVVHAGVASGRDPRTSSIRDLVALRRLDAPGRPWWYESYEGPELVLFGHTPSRAPRARHACGKLVALGLDTGCVYGGRLTAYSPELEELVSVTAKRAYAIA